MWDDPGLPLLALEMEEGNRSEGILGGPWAGKSKTGVLPRRKAAVDALMSAQ